MDIQPRKHIPYVLHLTRGVCSLLLFLADYHPNLISGSTFASKKDAILLIQSCFCVHCVLFRCLLYPKNTSRNRRWSTSPGNREPCLHPAASKRQMAGEDAAADAVRSCLLGSHLVLTWQKMQYHSQAGKQITLTSVAGSLFVSHPGGI